MAQVVTPDNNVEFITTGKVADFKPPEPVKTDAKPEVKAENGAAPQADAAKAATPETQTDQPRGEDGKFKKAGEDPAATSDADEDAKLTEKIQRIINKKHREMREAQEFATGEGRRAIAAERRAAELEREIAALRSGKSDGPGADSSVDPDEPKPADFKTVGEYTRALVKYEAKKAGDASKANAETTRQQSEANAMVNAFAKRQDEFKATTADYEEVVNGSELELHQVGMQYLIESEMGPQLAYHLAKNPDEGTRLKKLSPSRLLAELGKMEAKLEGSKAAPVAAAPKDPPQVSRAPAPIQTIEGKSTTVVKDPSQMSFQELREHRRQEQAKRAAAGR